MGIFDKAKDALHSEGIEEKSDAVLDKVEDFASKKLGEDKAEKVSKVRRHRPSHRRRMTPQL